MPLAAQYAAMGNGNGTALDGGATVPGADFSMRNEEGRPSVAYDSLDFILNDVLGSSQWSGILQDIWRTDI
jgi:hypothetical protein